jgi:hypothetical protein
MVDWERTNKVIMDTITSTTIHGAATDSDRRPVKKSDNHIVVFSHGFGVRKDDRGLFPDIIAGLGDLESVMFDYNDIHEVENTLTVLPLSRQVEMLKDVLSEIQKKYPTATIDVICHSQGAVVAALAKPSGVRKTFFLAPPIALDYERILILFRGRPGTEIRMDGMSKLSRRDGSTTLVPAEYFSELRNIHPIELYNELADKTELTIIKAHQDEILGTTDFSDLRDTIRIIGLPGNHSFSGDARVELSRLLTELINQ